MVATRCWNGLRGEMQDGRPTPGSGRGRRPAESRANGQ
jgi:hypothetical protein